MDIIRQPSSRVRTAVIALLLAHPEFSKDIPLAISHLRTKNRLALKLFYTAAVYLQRIYFTDLYHDPQKPWQRLPDLFSNELNIPAELDPSQALNILGHRHRELTNTYVNWKGHILTSCKNFYNDDDFEELWNH